MIDQAENLRLMVKNNLNKEKKNIIKSNKAKIITVASGKGGVGKSNVVVNLAVQLQKAGKRVVVIDADFGFANVDLICGVTAKYNFIDLIHKDMSIIDILTTGPLGVKFISGASEVKDILNYSDDQISKFIENFTKLEDIADIILIDTGAGISESAISFIEASHDLIIVTTPEPTSITDAYVLLKTIKNRNIYNQDSIKVGLIVNQVDSLDDGNQIFGKLKNVANKFLEMDVTNLGYIPYDKNLRNAVRLQVPLSIAFPKSKATLAFEQLIKNFLIDEDSNQVDQSKRGIYFFIKKLVSKN